MESESKIAINWLKDNHMIVNLRKFQAVTLDKWKENHTDQIINIVQKNLNHDQKLNFQE